MRMIMQRKIDNKKANGIPIKSYQKRARKAYMGGGKEKTFDWRGKEYHTRWKDETPKQQLATRKGKTKGVDDWQRKVAKKYGGGKV